MKKPGFTFDQHKALGQELNGILNRLDVIQNEIGKAYPFKVSATLAPARKAISEVKGLLEEFVCRENPSNQEALRIYSNNDKLKTPD